jgi:hypothetical protein
MGSTARHRVVDRRRGSDVNVTYGYVVFAPIGSKVEERGVLGAAQRSDLRPPPLPSQP